MRSYKLYPVSRYVLLGTKGVGEDDKASLYELTGPYVWDLTLIKEDVKCDRIIRYYGKLYYRLEE